MQHQRSLPEAAATVPGGRRELAGSRRARAYLRAVNRKQRKRQLARRQAHGPAPDRPRNVLDRASYANVKQGHIVPRTYQLNFAVDEHVAVHVPGRSDCVRLHVQNAGTRSRFYRRTRPDGTPIDDIEASLDVLEGVAGPVLRAVADGAPLTENRKGVLAQFLAVQMLRGPAFFAKQHVDVEEFVPKVLTTAHIKPALVARTGGDMRLARQHVIEMFRQPTQTMLSMLSVSVKVSAVLGSMRWQLLHFDSPLVAYSDQPVVVWPLNVAAFAVPPNAPNFGPLNALEVRAPLSPHLVVLMTWADEPDISGPVEAPPVYAAETNKLVIAQADKQWMHRLGSEPPVAAGPIRPLSRAFEDRYTRDAVESSRRRAATAAYLDRVAKRRFIDDIEVVTINKRAAASTDAESDITRPRRRTA